MSEYLRLQRLKKCPKCGSKIIQRLPSRVVERQELRIDYQCGNNACDWYEATRKSLT